MDRRRTHGSRWIVVPSGLCFFAWGIKISSFMKRKTSSVTWSLKINCNSSTFAYFKVLAPCKLTIMSPPVRNSTTQLTLVHTYAWFNSAIYRSVIKPFAFLFKIGRKKFWRCIITLILKKKAQTQAFSIATHELQ